MSGLHARTRITLPDGAQYATAWDPTDDPAVGDLTLILNGAEVPFAATTRARLAAPVAASFEVTSDPTVMESLPEALLVPRGWTPEGRQVFPAVLEWIEATPGVDLSDVDAALDNPKHVTDAWTGTRVHTGARVEVVTTDGPDGTVAGVAINPLDVDTRNSGDDDQEQEPETDPVDARQADPDGSPIVPVPRPGLVPALPRDPSTAPAVPFGPDVDPAASGVPSTSGTFTPRGRLVLEDVVRWLQDHPIPGLDVPGLDDVVENAALVYPGWDGASCYARDGVVVTVGGTLSREGAEVILRVETGHGQGEDDTPPSVGAPAGRGTKRVTGKKADTRRPVPQTVDAFLDRVREYGFEVHGKGKHYGITHPDHPGQKSPIPRTPSDYRWAENQVAQIRRVFGIDVREPLDGPRGGGRN